MNKLVPLFVAALSLAVFSSQVSAGDAKTELETLVTKIKGKLGEGNRTEASLATELQEFDALLATHHGEKSDDVAQILFMKALLYNEIFEDYGKAMALYQQLGKEYPDTQVGKVAPEIEASLATKQALTIGHQFPDFDVKDLDGKPISVASRKGKVVLLDFWATWCGPCVRELPTVQAAYQKYHDKGFEVIGISFDHEKEKLTSFIKERQVPWPQYFDGEDNKLAIKYGVETIPTTFLMDQAGKIIARDLRGDELDQALEKALK